jgi:hypothetical protein
MRLTEEQLARYHEDGFLVTPLGDGCLLPA